MATQSLGFGKQNSVLAWSDFMALPQQDFTADFHCVTRWSKRDVKWTGVKVTDFLAAIDVDSSSNSYSAALLWRLYNTNLSLEDFARPENFLCTYSRWFASSRRSWWTNALSCASSLCLEKWQMD